MEKNIIFSVVTVCFNALPDLKRTLDSLWQQSYDGFESIVVDGASSDGTPEFLKQENKITRFVSEPDSGVYNAMNKAVTLCKGDFIIFMNAGDEFFNPFVLERVNQALQTHPECRFLFGDACIVPELGNPFFREYFAPIGKQNICHQSIFYHKSLFQDFGTYDEQLKIFADYDFNLRLLVSKHITPYHLSYPICRFYFGGLSSSPKYLQKQREDAFRLNLKWGRRNALSASEIVLIDAKCESDFLEIWKKYNHSFNRKLVFRLGDSAGLFSEINNMIFALVWAFDHKVQFELCSQFSNLGTVGWNQFFLPFTEELCRPKLLEVNRRYLRPEDDVVAIRKLKQQENVHLLTFDIFQKFFENKRFTSKVFNFLPLKVAGNSFNVASAFARAIYRLNPKTEEAIKQLVANRLILVSANGAVTAVNDNALVEDDFIAVQMRAGDIQKECMWRRQKLLGAQPYARYIRQLFSSSNAQHLSDNKSIFVFADDFRLVRQLAFLLPKFKVYSLCSPLEAGFDYDSFIKQDEATRSNGILKILANIELCRQASLFVGTRVSNPSWFLRLLLPEHKVHFVDCQRLMWQWQFNRLMDGADVSVLKFAGLPLFKIIKSSRKTKYKLFSVLPIYKIRQKGWRRTHYLFGFLPVWVENI